MAGNRGWRARQRRDAYTVAARREGYRARSAFKLLEMAGAALKPGNVVVDLGAAPGSWSQVIAGRVGPRGQVVAVDVLAMPPLAGVSFICGDFCADETQVQICKTLRAAPDAVVSDIAPNLTGIRSTDQENSARLNHAVITFARRHLKTGGILLFKAFAGDALARSENTLRAHFAEVKIIRPPATRRHSRELYFWAKQPPRPASAVAAE